MKTDYPETVCQINNYLFQGLGDAFVDVLLSDQPDEEQFVQAERILTAYTESLERILGSPSGSIQLMDTETLHEWFIR